MKHYKKVMNYIKKEAGYKMEQNIFENNNQKVVPIIADKLVINNLYDALDLMADVYNKRINNVSIHEKHLNRDFLIFVAV